MISAASLTCSTEPTLSVIWLSSTSSPSMLPDRDVTASQGPEGVLVGSGGETAEIDPDLATHVFVRKL